MANPRKFSEKIALHNQKQAEETAAFEKIMREVSDATSKPDEATLAQYGLGTLPHSHLADKMKSNDNQSNNNFRESRVRSVGVGPIRRPADRKIDTSPYNSGAYLSPPSDSSWRRTISDSAIHQSLAQNQDHHIFGTHPPFTLSPAAQRRITNVNSNVDIGAYSNDHSNQHAPDGRPRSSCGLTRLPGINIYPSSHDNSIQIPIGNNTGSLPDLTSVHFPSPLHIPLDQEHDHSSSPYSSSPITASPTTLSPTSIPTRHPNASFQYSLANSPADSNTFSPTHSQHGTSQQFLSVPGNKYLHFKKEENAYQPSQGCSQNQQSYRNDTLDYHLNNQNSPPNNELHGSHGNLTNLVNISQSNLSGYRSPKCRPSPGSSPGIAGSLPNSGDSNTSAPCSPASQTLGNNGQYEQFQTTEYYLNPSIQQHFEQFSLVDNTVPEYIAQSPNAHSYSQYNDGNFSHLNNSNMDTTQQSTCSSNINMQKMSNSMPPNILNSTNSHVDVQSTQQNLNTSQHSSQQSLSQQSNNSPTPNTPTSIPEIIFTDFSSATELTKDLFGDPLRPIDLELGTMDFVGYQMLSDPNASMIADPTIEESFRRDLN